MKLGLKVFDFPFTGTLRGVGTDTHTQTNNQKHIVTYRLKCQRDRLDKNPDLIGVSLIENNFWKSEGIIYFLIKANV